MTKEKIPWQNPNFRVIDGEGKSTDAIKDSSFSSAANMADRVKESNGDSLPLEIIEGGKTEETPNDRNVRVERIGPKNLPQIVWEMVDPARVKIKFKNNILSFFHRGNNTPNTTSGGSDK